MAQVQSRVTSEREKQVARLALAVLACFCIAPALPRVARACVTLEPPVIVDQFARVPANLVFFEVRGATPEMLRLVDAESGAPIAASVRVVGQRQVFAPDVPVAADRRLALEVEKWDATGDAKRFEFETSAAVDLALEPLELELVERDGPKVTFRYSYPEEYESIRHLVRLRFTLDGEPLSPGYPTVAGQITVKTTCDDLQSENSCDGIDSVPAGEHVLGLSMELVGLDQPPQSVSRSFETSCEGCNVGSTAPSASGLWLTLLAVGARALKSSRAR